MKYHSLWVNYFIPVHHVSELYYYLNNNEVPQHVNVPVVSHAKQNCQHAAAEHAKEQEISHIDTLCNVTTGDKQQQYVNN